MDGLRLLQSFVLLCALLMVEMSTIALLMVGTGTIALLMVGREEQYCSVDGV